jgi:hypothetical protein
MISAISRINFDRGFYMDRNTMEMHCLQQEIEIARVQLNDVLDRKSSEFLDDEIIKISQMLDELLVKYISYSVGKGVWRHETTERC